MSLGFLLSAARIRVSRSLLPAIGGTNQGIPKPALRGVITEVVTCDAGETTATWNDADNDSLISTGDTFDVVFAMCFFADTGTTLNGWGLAMTFGFDNLSGMDGAGTAIIDGDLDLDLSSNDNVVVNLSVGTTSLTVQQSGISETLSDFVLTETVDLNTLTQTLSASGILTSTLLEGSVTFETLQDFLVIGDDNPSAGQLFVSDSSSSVLVTVLDNINVQFDIDLNLDGMIDETIVVTWAELDIA
jgi:hypothetical protein